MRVTNPTPTASHGNTNRVMSPVAGQRASVATMVNPPVASNASSASSSGYSSMNGTNLPEVLAQQKSQQPPHHQQQQQKLHQQIVRQQAMSPPPPPLPEHHPQMHLPSGRQSLLYHQHNQHRQSVSTNNLNGLETELKKVCRHLISGRPHDLTLRSTFSLFGNLRTEHPRFFLFSAGKRREVQCCHGQQRLPPSICRRCSRRRRRSPCNHESG